MEGRWNADVEATRRYFTSHERPEGGWTAEHLMHGAKAPMLGEHGEGNDSRAYCLRLLLAAGENTMSDEMTELRDALDDAIRRAYCEPLYPPRPEEDPEIVRSIAQAAIITNPTAMRHLERVQAAAWDVVKERVDG